MKRKGKTVHQYLMCLLLSIGVMSCDKVFDHQYIQDNPNAVTDVSETTLLSGVLTGLAWQVEDNDSRVAYTWAGHVTGLASQQLGFSRYVISPVHLNWNNYYTTARQARLLQQKAISSGNSRLKAIGGFTEAFIVAKLTAFWGDVPYVEAFDYVRYPKPRFDKQVDVYERLQLRLDTVVHDLSSATETGLENNDFIFRGSLDKWKAAAHTLKARLYLHLGDYENAVHHARQGIAHYSGDALVPHGTSRNVDENVNFAFFTNIRQGATSFDAPAFLPGFMLGRIHAKTDESALYHHFFQFGLINSGLLDGNITSGAFFAQNAPVPILTYYENQLILAEALARQDKLDDALAALNGVRATLRTGYFSGQFLKKEYVDKGLRYDDLLTADLNPGGLSNPASWGLSTQEALIYEIVAQKYVVLFTQFESFTDIRRLQATEPLVQLPITLVVQTPIGTIPNRFVYPESENISNPNVPKGASGEVPDIWVKLPIFE